MTSSLETPSYNSNADGDASVHSVAGGYTSYSNSDELPDWALSCNTEEGLFFSFFSLAFGLQTVINILIQKKKFSFNFKSQTSSADSKRMVQCILLRWGGKETDREYCKVFVKQLSVTFFKHDLRTWPPLTITVCVALLEGCSPKPSWTQQNKKKIKCSQTPVYCKSSVSKGLLFCVSIAKHRPLY